MDLLHIFPHLNASLNALSGIFLLTGFIFIMKRQVSAHRFCMLTAASVSALFLVFYVSHHLLRTYYFGFGPTKFTGDGIIRPIYFTLTRIRSGRMVDPFVIVTLRRALRARYEAHVRSPGWCSGLDVVRGRVLSYFMLYHLSRRDTFSDFVRHTLNRTECLTISVLKVDNRSRQWKRRGNQCSGDLRETGRIVNGDEGILRS